LKIATQMVVNSVIAAPNESQQVGAGKGDRCGPILGDLRWKCGKARGSAEGSRHEFH